MMIEKVLSQEISWFKDPSTASLFSTCNHVFSNISYNAVTPKPAVLFFVLTGDMLFCTHPW
jgi:hypothetical protein